MCKKTIRIKKVKKKSDIENKNNRHMLNRSISRLIEHTTNLYPYHPEHLITIISIVNICIGPDFETNKIIQLDSFVNTIDGLNFPSTVISLAEEFGLKISECPKRNEINFKRKIRSIINGSKI